MTVVLHRHQVSPDTGLQFFLKNLKKSVDKSVFLWYNTNCSVENTSAVNKQLNADVAELADALL